MPFGRFGGSSVYRSVTHPMASTTARGSHYRCDLWSFCVHSKQNGNHGNAMMPPRHLVHGGVERDDGNVATGLAGRAVPGIIRALHYLLPSLNHSAAVVLYWYCCRRDSLPGLTFSLR